MSSAVSTSTDTMKTVFSLDQLARARAAADASGTTLFSHLVAQENGDAGAVLAALSATLRVALVPTHKLDSLTPDFSLVPFTEAAARVCLPIRRKGRMVVVVADPLQPGLLHWLERRLNGDYQLALCDEDAIRRRLAAIEGDRRAIDTLDPPEDACKRGDTVEVITLASIAEDDGAAVKLVNSTLYDALKCAASDIHLESAPDGMNVRYRIDGVLQAIRSVAGVELAEQAISRLKVMSELDIAEHRVPQDGRFKAQILDREVDFRVSIIPSIHGEDAVLRVLDKRAHGSQIGGLTLAGLGLDPQLCQQIRDLAGQPHGLLLVTGPTGSGKTTTLYAALSEVNHGDEKLITIEDPVEYQLPGVMQIPVNEKKGLSFARGLRSILRHDPDKIMVGEIRDPDTAKIAIQAALTGHLVLSTVHANSVFDVLTRFLHMDVDAYSLVSALTGILGQRLVRRICPHCRERYRPPSSLLIASQIQPKALHRFQFAIGRGCSQCRQTGYLGRLAIVELLILDDTLREKILRQAPLGEIKEAARRAGVKPLREVALNAVARGQTTLQEINRVTFCR